VRFDSLRLSWRGRSYYAAGAPEKELLSGADLAAVQALVSKPEFASELAE